MASDPKPSPSSSSYSFPSSSVKHSRKRSAPLLLSDQKKSQKKESSKPDPKLLHQTMYELASPVHNAKVKEFQIVIDGKVAAYVQYEIDLKEKTMDLQHTVTETDHRGKGLAGKVVLAAFQYAKAQSLKIIPTCTYIATFLRKNPEWKDQVIDSP
eukprot:jgi/Bigna1/85763/estExt_fgenesh1_pg.C_60044